MTIEEAVIIETLERERDQITARIDSIKERAEDRRYTEIDLQRFTFRRPLRISQREGMLVMEFDIGTIRLGPRGFAIDFKNGDALSSNLAP